jgi:hypothetical protein
MKPIQDMLGVWVQIELKIPHRIAAIGEKGNRGYLDLSFPGL